MEKNSTTWVTSTANSVFAQSFDGLNQAIAQGINCHCKNQVPEYISGT